MSAFKVLGLIAGRAWSLVQTLLPLARPGDMKQVAEFSDLVMGQYKSLVEQLEQVINDYFDLSKKIREMHEEMFKLKEQLADAVSDTCLAARVCPNVERK
jgi:uncharacterized protein involved in exopolysaccharide biosynthesis